MSDLCQPLLRAIQLRRSFKPKDLKPDPVDYSLVKQVLEAARWAPSHGKTEPWRFTVYSGENRAGLSRAFGQAYRENAEKRGSFTEDGFQAAEQRAWLAPVWIALALKPGIKPDGSRAMPEEEEVMALACAVQNLHLMASALGLGGMWTTGLTSVHPLVKNFVGISEPDRLMGFFHLGWPNIPWPEAKRRELEEIICWK